MERPNIKEYGFTAYIPFSKQSKRYKKDYERYELSLMNSDEQDIYKIRQNQLSMINFISWLIITIVTTIWGLYYNIPGLNKLDFLSLGLNQNGDWADHLTMVVVPFTSGTVIHNSPKLLPGKKLKFVGHVVVKIVPIILLLISTYLIFTEKKVLKIKKASKQTIVDLEAKTIIDNLSKTIKNPNDND